MSETEIKIIAPGDSDDPITHRVQMHFDNLGSPTLSRVLKMQRAELAHEGQKHAIDEQIEKKRDSFADSYASLGQLQKQLRHGPARSDATDEQEAFLKDACQRDKVAIAALQEEKARPFESALPVIINRLKTVPENVTLVPVDQPVVPKDRTAIEMFGETFVVKAERIAAKQTLRLKGSLPLTEVKAFARADVYRRAEKGRPNVGPALRFEHVETARREVFRPKPIQFPLDYGLGSLMSSTRIDVEAFLFWVNREQIADALDAEIEARFDPAFAMTADEHAAELARIDAEILELDYLACGYAAIAELQGLTVSYQQKVGKTYHYSDGLAILQVREVVRTADEIPAT